MTATNAMPWSTRFWTAGLLLGLVFLAWALFWPATSSAPATASSASSAGQGAAPMPAQQTRAPNAADPAWTRPLYFNDRRPRVAMLGPNGPGGAGMPNQEFDAVLTGIVRSPHLYMATLLPMGGKPARVRLGDEVEGKPGWRLVSLASRTATFRNGDRVQVLRLDAKNAAITPPAAAMPPMPIEMPGQPNELPTAAAPPATPGITGQAPTAPPVTSSSSTPQNTAPANTTQAQQIEAIRRRIEARRQQMRQPNSPEPSR